MTSDTRERYNRRRDERQAKDDVRPPGRSSKDTKHWCRGKEGVPHTPVCVDYCEHKRVQFRAPNEWKILLCSECNKELDYWMPLSWANKWNSQPPDWVK